MSGTPFNYSPISDGTIADVADLNVPFAAIAAAINGGLGTDNMQPGALDPSVMTTAGNPQKILADTTRPLVVSGLTVSTSGTLGTTIAAGVAYVNGKRVTPSSTPHTFTASKDTYVDLKDDGTYTYVEVSNGASSGFPLTTNTDGSDALRVAVIVTDGTTVSKVYQAGYVAADSWYGFDPLGNQVYNTNPRPVILGYAAITGNVTATSNTGQQVTGLSRKVIVPSGGRNLKITAYAYALSNSLASSNYGLQIWDGVVGSGTQLQAAKHDNDVGGSTSANLLVPAALSVVIFAAAGAKTFNVGAFTGAGTLTVGANATTPALLLIEAL